VKALCGDRVETKKGNSRSKAVPARSLRFQKYSRAYRPSARCSSGFSSLNENSRGAAQPNFVDR
jgi:hypothetical protein